MSRPVDRELLEAASAIQKSAYAPYSNYAVGAAVRGEDGRIFLGVNVENASYPLSLCAERSAIAAAVTAGVTKIIACAVVTSNGGSPCGACRQVLHEFGTDLVVFSAAREGLDDAQVFALSDLLPEAFGPNSLD